MTLNGDAEGFKERDAVGKDRDVRCGATDIERDGIFRSFRQAQDTHDTGGGTGENGPHGIFRRLSDFRCSAVRLENIRRHVCFNGFDKGEDVRNKRIIRGPYCGIEIGCGDAPRVIEVARHAMTEGKMNKVIVDHIGNLRFKFRIPRRKLPHDSYVADIDLSQAVSNRGDLIVVSLGDFDAPVVDIA